MPVSFVTTNVRLPEEDYLRLKMEAARFRISLASVIRKRLVISSKAKGRKYDIMDLAGSLKTDKKPLTNEEIHDLFAQSVME